MATSTPNYGLYKYGGGDAPDLTALGPSMDKIDTELKKNADNISLLRTPTRVTWRSDSDTWYSLTPGDYYVSGDGIDLGYPGTYLLITHRVWDQTTGFDSVVGGSVAVSSKTRRYTPGQPLAWN